MHKKFLAISMISIISLNAFPLSIFQKTTHAASFVSNVSKIENPVAGGSGGNWSGNYIYFGNYPQSDTSGATKEPIRWRVLDNNNVAWTGSTPTDNGFAYNIGVGDGKGGRQNAPVGGNGMLLYSDIALDAKQYHPTYRDNEKNELCWGGNGGGSGKGCTLWAWLNGYGNGSVWGGASVPGAPFLTNAFTSAEQNVIMPTNVYSEDLCSERGLASSARTSLTQDKIFVPSYNEILNTSYGFVSTLSSSNTRSFDFSNYSNNLKQDTNSWLRSPGYGTNYASAANLGSVGYVDYGLSVDDTFGLCPAFNLNLTSVIFASEAAESGSSGAGGDGKKSSAVSSTPTRFSLPTGKGNDYKLTIHDTSRDGFNATANGPTISYSGARTGNNEYISCLIADTTTSVKYYGKLKAVGNASSGTATLNLPSEYGYNPVNVMIFNEQCNGDKKTDWCGNLVELSVTAKKTPTVTAPTAKTLTYNKNAQALVNAGRTTGGTLQYKLNNGSYQTNIPTATNAGTYTVWYRVVGNDEYLDVAEKSVSVTIKKATPNVTAPTAIQNLVYNSKQQELVNAGSTTGGTLQYKVGSRTYSTNIPTEINAGTHTVYYKVVNDTNYNDVAEKSLNVTIAKANPEVTDPTAKEDLVYNSKQQSLLNAGTTSGGTFEYSLDGQNYSTEISKGTNAGDYIVYYRVAGGNNYNDAAAKTIEATIKKADPQVTAPTAKILTYNTNPQQLIEAGNTTGGTLEYSLDNKKYSTTFPTGIAATTYTVYYRVVGDNNYNDAAPQTVSVTISKATPIVIAPTPINLTYNKNEQELVGVGSTTGGTIQYSLKSDSEYTENVPTAIEAGNYTVYYKVIGNESYNEVAPQTVTVKIQKANPQVEAPTAKENLIYNSEQQELLNIGTTTGGTFEYSLDNKDYSPEVSKSINAGEYTVYYRIAGGNNYNDVAPETVKVTIAKATPKVTAPTAKILTYTGDAQPLIDTGSTDAGTLQYKEGNGEYSINIPTQTNAGTYTVYYKVVGNNNYNDVAEKSFNVTIAKADPKITAPTAKELTYNGDPQELVEVGSTTGGTLEYSLDNESYSTTIPTGMIASTYTVYYRVVGDDNYNSISEESLKVTIIIDKAIPEAPPAPQKERKSRYSITLKPLEPNEYGAKPEYKIFNGKSIFEATPASQNQNVLKSNIKLKSLEQENESENKNKDETPWQESNVFKNLIPNKEYTFYSRYAATEDGNFAPSLPSEPIKIRTLKKSKPEEEIEEDENKNNETDEPIKVNQKEVGISDKIQQIETENGIANIETKRSGNDIEIKITDKNGNPITITDGIILVAECDQDSYGIVAATINDDGTIKKIIRKSVVKGGKIYIPLNCSGKIRIVDNSKLFYDVFASHWAYDAVTFVSAHELFNGTAPNIFEPETPMSRAMMVQVLHNLEDNPKQAFEKIFSDVNDENWFAEAVTWGATHRGTIIGYDDGRFGPNDNITREQLATILYRYFGENEVVDTDLNFVDANEISDYALKALHWAVKYEIVQGKGNNVLDPKGLATRAQVAQMLQNLMLNVFYK